jgi:hypothetical protein
VAAEDDDEFGGGAFISVVASCYDDVRRVKGCRRQRVESEWDEDCSFCARGEYAEGVGRMGEEKGIAEATELLGSEQY